MNSTQASSLVPRIAKEQFDTFAAAFLSKYWPDAFYGNAHVPIMKIAREKMGLTIVMDYRLSEDFSVYGQIHFTKGLATIYDKEKDEYRDVAVDAGTVFIDPDTLNKRNVGCLNNTVAHECVHWFLHRKYYVCPSRLDSSFAIAHRCAADDKAETESPEIEWTDIDWIEWQANSIAPRILMPKGRFCITARRIIQELREHHRRGTKIKPELVVGKLARAFKVSKQSAAIRMTELKLTV